MQHVKTKVTIAALAVLLTTLPEDEGVRFKPYYDIAGVLTVCYGHTGNDIVKNKTYTEQECLEFLRKDTERHMNVVQSCSTRPMNVNQLVAFTSFDFNTGAWCSSRSKREFNAGNEDEACRALAFQPSGKPAWSYINGTTYVEGLHKRRIREMDRCRMKDDTKISDFGWNSGWPSWLWDYSA